MNNMVISNKSFFRILSVLFFCAPILAIAHHPLDGMTPSNFFEGLLSGIGHPIIGLDHLAFVLAAGVLAWKMGKPIMLLTGFIIATAIGSIIISMGVSFEFKEPLILLSVALVGFSLVWKKQLDDKLVLLFYVLAGFMHGSAYGEAIVGAEATPIVAYLVGFAIIQFAIAFAAAQIIKFFSKGTEDNIQFARITGAMVMGIAVTYGFEMAESAMFAV